MTKRFWRRVEGRYGDGWARLNNQYEDNLMMMDVQDYGETIKFFKLEASYFEVKLDKGALRAGTKKIEAPVYLAPVYMEIGDIVYVPVGHSRFNKGTIVKKVDKPEWNVRAIDEVERTLIG